MTKHRFHPGDQVVVVEDTTSPFFFSTYPELLGSVGHVASVDDISVGVDFNDGFLCTDEAKQFGFHNLNGKIPRNTGWFIAENELEFFDCQNDNAQLISQDEIDSFLCV